MLKTICTSILVLFVLTAKAQQPTTYRIDSNGYRLREFYRSLDVEHLWLKGHHVDWETGVAKKEVDISNKRTHCSRFVAAGCMRANIYILRPPDCKDHLMANAQYDWLMTDDARKNGWLPIESGDIISTYCRAQEYANEGYVTVAVCKNDDEDRSGHIAFVTPAIMSYDEIKAGGPMLTQAGHFNANATPLIRGFEHHISTWPETTILFYYNRSRPRLKM